MDGGYIVKPELFAQLSQKTDPFIETVKQRELDIGAEDLEHHAGKTRARADIGYAKTGDASVLDDLGTVEKMEPCGIALFGYGREVHYLIHLHEKIVIYAQPFNGALVNGDAELGNSG